MAGSVSPLAPARFPDLPAVAGARLATGRTGIRYQGRDDLLLAVLDPGTTVAGSFTRSATPGHPIPWCRRVLAGGRGRALVVNAGNANVFVGPAGDAAVRAEAEAVAALVGCAAEEVFVASTGVIGVPLDSSRITAVLPELAARLGAGGFEAAARAIATTDTFPKGAVRRATIAGVPVTLAGIAKGSGMIAPDMATMLAFLFTDAAIAAPALQRLLNEAIDRSFHSITVDGDTSTSDSVLLFATATAGNAPADAADDPALLGFREALDALCLDLALQVVRDGEGAEKLVRIAVEGTQDDGSARRIGLAIANSPLVKTAIAGADANWGRVVMALGKAGEPIRPERVRIAFGGHDVAREGQAVPDLDEAPVAAHLAGREVALEVEVGDGPGRAVVWTCDLTHGYISINAEYRS
jgi:glutamate N-acetyltransferase / amino-acid N-acetyltransferase